MRDEMTDRRTAREDVRQSRSSSDARRDFGLKKAPSHVEALDRVRAWTRERFKLAEASPILVAEVACGLPGCPPLETVVAFWTEDDRRHQFKLFKPVAEVICDDLPFAWLKDSLVWNGEDECC
jgi:nitrate reductase delta subunit